MPSKLERYKGDDKGKPFFKSLKAYLNYLEPLRVKKNQQEEDRQKRVSVVIPFIYKLLNEKPAKLDKEIFAEVVADFKKRGWTISRSTYAEYKREILHGPAPKPKALNKILKPKGPILPEGISGPKKVRKKMPWDQLMKQVKKDFTDHINKKLKTISEGRQKGSPKGGKRLPSRRAKK